MGETPKPKPEKDESPSATGNIERDPNTGQALHDRSLTEGEDDKQSDGGVGSARDTAESKNERLR